MGLEQKIGDKDNAQQLRDALIRRNIPPYLINNSIKVLERSYAELKKEISGIYYSGCCF